MDVAVGRDQIGDALRDPVDGELVVRVALCTVGVADRLVGIGEELVREALSIGEGLLVFDGVVRNAEDLGIGCFEF